MCSLCSVGRFVERLEGGAEVVPEANCDRCEIRNSCDVSSCERIGASWETQNLESVSDAQAYEYRVHIVANHVTKIYRQTGRSFVGVGLRRLPSWLCFTRGGRFLHLNLDRKWVNVAVSDSASAVAPVWRWSHKFVLMRNNRKSV